ncbi:AzlC family ABC transporter permease [Sciscionella sediminilitoris]|uniref:AzlC family ABC transporter permease n=1 Tax=Sciscionella sediminilitoris TaxID=1445613 RepID=UPI0004DEF1A8|nr:AzlC family ABC transporter permease [Sciscionella sp. SE31]
MRSFYRTLRANLDAKTVRDISLLLAAAVLDGISFGAIAVGYGLPVWVPVVMTLLVFAGGSQLLLVGLVGAGASPAMAVAAGLLVNLRHLPFGLAVSDLIGKRLAARLVGTHLMVDESVAFALAKEDRNKARASYWTVGVGMFFAWTLGVVIGALVGRAVGDVRAFGVDAAFPAVLFALVLPALKDRNTLAAVLLGCALALTTTTVLPAGVPVLVALLGLVVLAVRRSERAACP